VRRLAVQENSLRRGEGRSASTAGWVDGVKLPRLFYDQPTLQVAQALLGTLLVHRHPEGTTAGKIIETEAYVGPEDKASHASRGRTPRSLIMFGPPGFAYVYLIYGLHHCLNVVTEPQDYPAAVLIRAVEPIAGIQLMQARRGISDVRQLTNGPGKVCQAFAIDRCLNGADMCSDNLYVEDRHDIPSAIVASTRVGVDYAGPWKDKCWRFYIAGHAGVSKR
jgi:DNA-3-methyladenine glycosylase